jgi:HTH-type transcriptional regulator, quorum sensing regulator NprR
MRGKGLAVELKLRTPAVRAAEQMGARIRQARTEMGMSMTALAGSDYSRAFINQIELGRARPSIRTLQLIAERLNRSVEYFLQDQNVSTIAMELALIEAQTKLRGGNPERARVLMAQLLERQHLPAEIRLRAQLSLAEALMRLGFVVEAVPLLEGAIRTVDSARWPTLTAELYYRMGSAQYLRSRSVEAGAWFDKALSVFQAWGLADPLLKARILGHRANLYFLAGNTYEAIAGYENAIAEAEGVLDPQGLAGIYEGLALSLQKAGQLERALAYAKRSLQVFESLQDARMSAKLRNNMAEILLEQGRAGEAERLFKEGAAQLDQVGDTKLLPHLLAGIAEATFEQGDVDQARIAGDKALAVARKSRDKFALLVSERVSGRIASAQGRLEEAHQHFDTAMQIAKTMPTSQASSRVAYEYARMLEASGDALGAAVRYREAYEMRKDESLPGNATPDESSKSKGPDPGDRAADTG